MAPDEEKMTRRSPLDFPLKLCSENPGATLSRCGRPSWWSCRDVLREPMGYVESLWPAVLLEMRSSATGGRSSVSGIVATVFGTTGFLGRYVQIAKEHGGIMRYIQVSFLGASSSSSSKMLKAKAAAEEAILRELLEATVMRPL